ncbi:hypothetical protein BU183_10255 [Enterococcus faecium]|nr:hypothetical protein BU183_10255 [Enterococcus faecium]
MICVLFLFFMCYSFSNSKAKGDVMKRTRVLYLEVADKIKEDIFSGKYPVGSMLLFKIFIDISVWEVT